MRRLILTGGVVGDHDGAYDWLPKELEKDPDYSIGHHSSSWPGESYTVVEIREPELEEEDNL